MFPTLALDSIHLDSCFHFFHSTFFTICPMHFVFSKFCFFCWLLMSFLPLFPSFLLPTDAPSHHLCLHVSSPAVHLPLFFLLWLSSSVYTLHILASSLSFPPSHPSCLLQLFLITAACINRLEAIYHLRTCSQIISCCISQTVVNCSSKCNMLIYYLFRRSAEAGVKNERDISHDSVASEEWAGDKKKAVFLHLIATENMFLMRQSCCKIYKALNDINLSSQCVLISLIPLLQLIMLLLEIYNVPGFQCYFLSI